MARPYYSPSKYSFLTHSQNNLPNSNFTSLSDIFSKSDHKKRLMEIKEIYDDKTSRGQTQAFTIEDNENGFTQAKELDLDLYKFNGQPFYKQDFKTK